MKATRGAYDEPEDNTGARVPRAVAVLATVRCALSVRIHRQSLRLLRETRFQWQPECQEGKSGQGWNAPKVTDLDQAIAPSGHA